MDNVDALVAAVCDAPKYRNLDAGLVRSVAATEIAKGHTGRDAVKATRNKLHQVAGAYLVDKPNYAAWLRDLQAAVGDPANLRGTCRRIMAHHASTRERLPILEQFYPAIFAGLGPIYSVMDLACGLNPVALPWMALPPGVAYFACDVYADQVEFLNGWLACVGRPGRAEQCNLLAGPPAHGADVALLLKTIPCLEQAHRAAGQRLLEEIDARVLIVSFPVQSLGGRKKGMPEQYAGHLETLAAGKPWRIERFDFATELVFRISR